MSEFSYVDDITQLDVTQKSDLGSGDGSKMALHLVLNLRMVSVTLDLTYIHSHILYVQVYIKSIAVSGSLNRW